MQYLIRLIQVHEDFRRAEIDALATLANVDLKIISYSLTSPFCIIEFPNQQNPDEAAARFISRSILSKGIYELWGSGTTYDDLHANVRTTSQHLWPIYQKTPFKFSLDAFSGKRSVTEQTQIIDTFQYLPFSGGISLKSPEVEFVIFEQWDLSESPHHQKLGQRRLLNGNAKPPPPPPLLPTHHPKALFLGRKISPSSRHLIDKHDLKQRPYISTTSMDAELALVTANLALAAPGKFILDPFVGTGSFLLAAAELGATTLGSDIDGRSFRGKHGRGLTQGVGANFARYNLTHLFTDCLTSDLVHTPFRHMNRGGIGARWLDALICDPPYGVREGLKVLGTRKAHCQPGPGASVPHHPTLAGVPSYKADGYIAPKKPYSFVRMLDDVLDFAAGTLVDGGRLVMWMPTVNDEIGGDGGGPGLDGIGGGGGGGQLGIPTHAALVVRCACVQAFNKWSRRLLVYERKKGDGWGGGLAKELGEGAVEDEVRREEKEKARDAGPAEKEQESPGGVEISSQRINANDLNPFRKRYFQGFEDNG